VASAEGLALVATQHDRVAAGERVVAFIRPEAMSLARRDARPDDPALRYQGVVESVLFDGANSSVLVREATTRATFRVALSQSGRHADIGTGDNVAFGFDPAFAACFRAPAA
jgi:spermidine/putrescine transport system ATP-binding protein